MKNIKTRLKQANADGDVVMRGLNGWITNGKWAIHRVLLTTQGLRLPEDPKDDLTFLEGLGYVTDRYRTPDVNKVLPTKKLVPFRITRVLYALDKDASGNTVAAACISDKLTVLVDMALLSLRWDVPFGETLYAADSESALVDEGRQFVVMPFRDFPKFEDIVQQMSAQLQEAK